MPVPAVELCRVPDLEDGVDVEVDEGQQGDGALRQELVPVTRKLEQGKTTFVHSSWKRKGLCSKPRIWEDLYSFAHTIDILN